MLVIAHRGANKEALENSWEAFDKAIEGGSQRIELDARMTRDGVPVVLHDKELARLVGLPASLRNTDWADLSRRRLKDQSEVPRVEEVIERLLPRVELNIEIKGTSLALTDQVCRMVKKSTYAEQVIISTPWPSVAGHLRDNYPDIARACLTGYFDGIIWPFFAYQSPSLFMEFAKTKICHPRVQMVDENFMDQARNRGWIVYPWVTMDAEETDKEGLWAQMATLDVDGLCTNYPRQLARWLDETRLDGREIAAIAAGR